MQISIGILTHQEWFHSRWILRINHVPLKGCRPQVVFCLPERITLKPITATEAWLIAASFLESVSTKVSPLWTCTFGMYNPKGIFVLHKEPYGFPNKLHATANQSLTTILPNLSDCCLVPKYILNFISQPILLKPCLMYLNSSPISSLAKSWPPLNSLVL